MLAETGKNLSFLFWKRVVLYFIGWYSPALHFTYPIEKNRVRARSDQVY
jgi:hypothetical protein